MERRHFLLKVLGAGAAGAAAIAATQAQAASRLLDGTSLSPPAGVQLAQTSPTPSGNPDQSGATPNNLGTRSGPRGADPMMSRRRRPMRRKMRRRMRRRSTTRTNEADPANAKTPD